MKLYRFEARWGRSETIEGIFAAEEADVAAAYGVAGYLESPCGKHSGGGFTLAPAHMKVLTDDAAFIAKALEYGLFPTGVNPLTSALTCGTCGDSLPAPYDACRHASCGWKRSG